ncbi:MAG: hypothetical protein UU93_C0012G0005 [Candidatus Amesbacteria bacterium GW2011_GWA2_42_12]|uniref:PIN domain-containing protein n=1 Tax=Candidatus Amesbacteria bacterium GW2011_GWA2_42_12 TaxID=1618356 RepID=A0A0G1ACZ5_9BACT|nr:MAG: hypothetical protein UU93_C0012G0005 [Candidatus Amesbacteria bacterium GW2011_GWA2_42_12]
MKRYLVDSDFLVAVFNEKDSSHTNAMILLKKIGADEIELWMTNLVRQESATVISHRVDMNGVRLYVKKIVNDIHKFVDVDKSLENDSWRIFLKQTKKGCSFVDCSNLAIVEKYKLDGILTFDQFYPKRIRVV